MRADDGILFAALRVVLVVFACVSVSKFVFSDKKELVGVYTDFVLSHDGDGKTVEGTKRFSGVGDDKRVFAR